MRLTNLIVLCLTIAIGGFGCAKKPMPPGHPESMSSDPATAGKAVGRAVTAPIAKLGSLLFEPAEPPAPVETDEPPLLDPNAAYRFGFNTQWMTTVAMSPDQTVRHAVLLDDLLIVVENRTNFVTAINIRDGSIRWQQRVGSPLDQLFEPVRYNEEILINSETHLYSLFADTGQVVGRSAMETAVVDKPAIIENYAVFGGLNSRVFGHGINTGRTHWSYAMTGGIVVRPVTSGINIFVTDSNGVYAMVNGRTGRAVWKGQTFGRISAEPAINSLGVFVACDDQTLYAINRSTGTDRWTYRAADPLKKSPIVIDNTLFLPDPSGDLLAIDALSGEHLWRYRGDVHPVTVRDDQLIMYESTRLITLDLASGKTIRQVSMQPLLKVLTGPDNSLILINDKGRLMRLDPER